MIELAKFEAISSTNEAMEWIKNALDDYFERGPDFDFEAESLKLGAKWELEADLIKKGLGEREESEGFFFWHYRTT